MDPAPGSEEARGPGSAVERLLSVVIVTWNSAADIAACLDSIHSSRPFEVVVVDNASRDDTRAVLSRYHHLTIIQNSTNTGYARANNQGINRSAGDLVLLLNPDTRLGPDAIDCLVDCLESHPDYGAAAPRLVNPDGTVQRSIRSFPNAATALWELSGLSRLFPMNRRFGAWRMAWFDYGRPATVDQPMASCLLVRRSVLAELGGFDESLPIFFNDVDLSLRMKRTGSLTGYVPCATVVHRRGAATGQARPRMIREWHRSLFRFLRKHDRTGWFWLKAVPLLPLLELSAELRVLKYRLSRR